MNGLYALFAILALAGCATPAPLSLERPSGAWVLERLDGPIAEGLERPTILFSEGDRISGFAGCNRYFGQRTPSPNAAAYFSGVGVTKMACLGPAMDLEQRYLAGLDRARDARVVDGRLVLFDANDREIMRFAPQPADLEQAPPRAGRSTLQANLAEHGRRILLSYGEAAAGPGAGVVSAT